MSNGKRQSVYPTMRYDDPDKAVEYLTNVLGLKEHTVYRDDGKIVHAQFEWDGDLIMFGPSVLRHLPPEPRRPTALSARRHLPHEQVTFRHHGGVEASHARRGR
jgi:uncharacterized glyoxalase superfamily protein PhnB